MCECRDIRPQVMENQAENEIEILIVGGLWELVLP